MDHVIATMPPLRICRRHSDMVEVVVKALLSDEAHLDRTAFHMSHHEFLCVSPTPWGRMHPKVDYEDRSSCRCNRVEAAV
jgi:hypothetical protein